MAASACESMRRALMSLDGTTQHRYKRRKKSERIEIDIPCEGEERLFNTYIYLRRGLNKLDSEFLRKLTALVLCYSPLIRPVRLVADENLVHSFRSMLLDVGVPRADVYASVRMIRDL